MFVRWLWGQTQRVWNGKHGNMKILRHQLTSVFAEISTNQRWLTTVLLCLQVIRRYSDFDVLNSGLMVSFTSSSAEDESAKRKSHQIRARPLMMGFNNSFLRLHRDDHFPSLKWNHSCETRFLIIHELLHIPQILRFKISADLCERKSSCFWLVASLKRHLCSTSRSWISWEIQDWLSEVITSE